METRPLRETIDESKTSTNATAGNILEAPDTIVIGGGCKNCRVTQWSCSLVVVAFELQARQAPCVPFLDHVPTEHCKHSVLFAFANVPPVQLGQNDTVSEVENVPGMHLEQSCALEEIVSRKSNIAVTLRSMAALMLTK